MNLERPLSVKYKERAKILELQWVDGSQSVISGQSLRRYCACSNCRSKQQVGVDVITDSAEVIKLVPIGASGLQIIYSDGHDRGIYPWEYLRAIAENRAMGVLSD